MWIKADMHIHSTYSDGSSSPKEILRHSLYRGLRAISITDHDTFQGSVVASRESSSFSGEILVVIGIEVRTNRGDILLYCHDPIDTPRRVDVLIDYAHENNCIVVPAHPFDKFRSGIGEAIYEYSGWDAIEAWNASADKGANKRAIRAAAELNLAGLANSDAHIVEYVGSAYTSIDLDELSVEALFKAIKNRKTKPHYGYPPLKHFLKRVSWSIYRRLSST